MHEGCGVHLCMHALGLPASAASMVEFMEGAPLAPEGGAPLQEEDLMGGGTPLPKEEGAPLPNRKAFV